MHVLRKKLNYQTAILKELSLPTKLSEEEEIKLIKQVLKEARNKTKITSEVDLEVERFNKYLKENIKRKKFFRRVD